MKTIFIDAGNTNIKFLTDTGKKKVFLKASSLEELSKSLNKSDFETAIYSSVLTLKKTKQLRNILSRISKNVFSARQLALSLFKSSYNMNQIGEDRIAALSYCLFKEIIPCVVVDAGTAITIDFLDKPNVFLGGYICAGIGTELKALSLMTDNLPEVRVSKNTKDGFPDCTAQAMESGVLKVKALGISGLINQILERNNLNPFASAFPAACCGVSKRRQTEKKILAEEDSPQPAPGSFNHKAWKIILTGGDAVNLKKYMPDSIIKSELVINGLNVLWMNNYI